MTKLIRAQLPKYVIGGNGGCQYELDTTKGYWEGGLFMN